LVALSRQIFSLLETSIRQARSRRADARGEGVKLAGEVAMSFKDRARFVYYENEAGPAFGRQVAHQG
jgi:hypothetical protein